MDASVRLLLVDDHAVVRQGLKMFLTMDPGLEIVGEAANGREALDLVEKLSPDVVLMDLLMPVMDGITAIREIKRRFPDVEVIALTSVLEDEKVVGAVQAGAMGYLLKDTQADALIEAIYAASRGEVRLHPEAARRLVREVRTPDMRESLTPRETEILRFIGRGYSNKNIARELDLSERTVKTHVSSLLSKLGLSSRTQAALFGLREGIVGLE
jgi:NarL family two-component system response regulator LiaR